MGCSCNNKSFKDKVLAKSSKLSDPSPDQLMERKKIRLELRMQRLEKRRLRIEARNKRIQQRKKNSENSENNV